MLSRKEFKNEISIQKLEDRRMKNKELELLASLKKVCRLMDEIDTFKNEIALAEVQEYLRAIRFKSLWYLKI